MATRTTLVDKSLTILRAGQSPNGAIVACPRFSVYGYCWFRDGAFVAQALDLWGEHATARRFYDWAARTVVENADDARAALAHVATTRLVGRVPPSRYLHTRYMVDGTVGKDDWPNFQLDGFGTLLWGMVEHLRLTRTSSVPTIWEAAIDLLVAYLATLWPVPNFDCWEEFPDEIHVSTLSTLYGGLQAVATKTNDSRAAKAANNIRSFVVGHITDGGYLPKFVGSRAVDASLIWACIPFGMFDVGHPVMERTVEKIEEDLQDADGGVHRYAADSYYGGGQWILLTGLLAEYLLRRGAGVRAAAMAGWLEDQATSEGAFPEQIPRNLSVPEMYEPWLERWGPIASPLLWSHAAYLRLKCFLS
jgi:GH15 family glucan-1,4-alpha-glucosidase